MKSSFTDPIVTSVALVYLLANTAATAPLGVAFTYQGKLTDAGKAANGLYDVCFALCDAPTNGNRVSIVLTNSATLVSNGVFSIMLDFGAGAFTGDPRWLEIGVRTNGSGGGFTALSPRQALTPAPYALFSPNAGSATSLSGSLPAEQLAGMVAPANLPTNLAYLSPDGVFTGDGGGLENLQGSNILAGSIEFSKLQASTNGSLVLSNIANSQGGGWLVVSNGSLYLPASTANGNFPEGFDPAPSQRSGAIFFMGKDARPDQLDAVGGHILNLGWLGNGGVQYAGHNLWFEEGWYSGQPGSIVLGNDGATGGTVDIRYDGWQSFYFPNSPNEVKLTNSCTPSKLLRFRSEMLNTSGVTVEARPAIWGRAAGTNVNSDIDPNGEGLTLGELWFLTASPGQEATTTTRWGWNTNTMRIGGIMMTNGWDLRGRLVQERRIVTVSGPTYVLDFSKIPHALTIRLNGDVAFSSTNWSKGPSVFDSQLVFLRSGGAGRSLSFPAEWHVSSESGTAVLPTFLPAYTGMRIRLESLGGGENNIIANFERFSDIPAADAAADNFFSRSALTPSTTQRRAVYQLCTDLKMAGLWERIDAIYPFVGTQDNQRYNLKSASYTITWTGLTETNFGANGVTGNGSGYGDTGLNPSTTGGQFRVGSAFIACYVGNATPGDGTFMGVVSGTGSAMLTKTSATGLESRGPDCTQITERANFGTDWRGLLSLHRDGWAYARLNDSEPALIPSSPAGLPDGNIHVLAGYWVPDGHYPDGVSRASTANLRAAIVGGGGVTSPDMDTLLAIIETFESNLGRKAN